METRRNTITAAPLKNKPLRPEGGENHALHAKIKNILCVHALHALHEKTKNRKQRDYAVEFSTPNQP